MISRSCVKFGRHFCCSYQILAEDWFLCNQITSLNHNLIFLFWTLETATEFNKKPLTAVQGRQCPAGTKMTFPDDFSKGVLNLPGNLTGYCMRWTVKASKTCDLHRGHSQPMDWLPQTRLKQEADVGTNLLEIGFICSCTVEYFQLLQMYMQKVVFCIGI